jgi:hypothetical protein
LKPTNKSYRTEETYIKVKGQDKYLYRAVDSTGQTIEFLLTAKRDTAAAKRFFRKALSSPGQSRATGHQRGQEPGFSARSRSAEKRKASCLAESVCGGASISTTPYSAFPNHVHRFNPLQRPPRRRVAKGDAIARNPASLPSYSASPLISKSRSDARARPRMIKGNFAMKPPKRT